MASRLLESSFGPSLVVVGDVRCAAASTALFFCALDLFHGPCSRNVTFLQGRRKH